MPLHETGRGTARYMKFTCAVAVLGLGPREVNMSAGCHPLNARVYCCFRKHLSGLLTNGTDKTTW